MSQLLKIKHEIVTSDVIESREILDVNSVVVDGYFGVYGVNGVFELGTGRTDVFSVITDDTNAQEDLTAFAVMYLLSIGATIKDCFIAEGTMMDYESLGFPPVPERFQKITKVCFEIQLI